MKMQSDNDNAWVAICLWKLKFIVECFFWLESLTKNIFGGIKSKLMCNPAVKALQAIKRIP